MHTCRVPDLAPLLASTRLHGKTCLHAAGAGAGNAQTAYKRDIGYSTHVRVLALVAALVREQDLAHTAREAVSPCGGWAGRLPIYLYAGLVLTDDALGACVWVCWLACGCVGVLRVGQLFDEMARSNATMDAPEFLCMIQELLPQVSCSLARSLSLCLFARTQRGLVALFALRRLGSEVVMSRDVCLFV